MTNFRTPGKRGDAEDFYANLKPGEALARVQAAAAVNDATAKNKRGHSGGATQTPQGRTKRAYFSFAPACDFKAALALADALIVAKGGIVPMRANALGWTYAQLAEAHEAALARREQRYERSKTA